MVWHYIVRLDQYFCVSKCLESFKGNLNCICNSGKSVVGMALELLFIILSSVHKESTVEFKINNLLQ